MIPVSVIIPVYNEVSTIKLVIDAVSSRALEGTYITEIIIIDDASTDGPAEVLKNYNDPLLKIILKENNGGKGSCIRLGLDEAKGDIIIIQDADLEYDPKDYQVLLNPILIAEADVVYGSRFKDKPFFSTGPLVWEMANRFLTLISNLCTGLRLSDMETCYKVLHRKAINLCRGRLVSNRFAIEPELTARLSRGGMRIVEVPISYNGRSHEEGKKIGWRDGLAAIGAIIRFIFIR